MNRGWKPGDLAMVFVRGKQGERVAMRDTHGWAICNVHGDRAHAHWVNASEVIAIRPLVVIDLDDTEAVERLAGLLHNYDAHLADDPHRESAWVKLAADALREYAAPKPPKPEEPTGLGAVVEDAEGGLFIRTADTDCGKPWSYANNFSVFGWSQINAVRVLSEGVAR